MSEENFFSGIYRNITDNAPVGIVLTDTKNGDGDRPIVYTNRAFEELTGYPEEEIVGKDCRFLQGEETDPYTVEKISDALENEEHVTAVIENYTREGELFYNRLELEPVYNEGDLEGFVGYQLDVTDIVSEKEEKDLLLRIVNHDLRNDISLVRSWNQMKEENNVDASDRISQRLEDMEDTIDAVETYRRLEKDDYVESVNVSRMLEEQVEDYRQEGTSLEFETSIEPGLSGDAGLLLENLYENLIRNVEVHAEADRVLLKARREGENIFTSVEDDGKGLPANVERLVAEGYRGDLSGGMGLGLFIVDRITEKYGLELDTFESDLGGAGFSVRIPSSD